MNKVILMGRLTKDPEIRYTSSAEPLCIAKFTLAVNRRFKKDGEQDADFIFCTAFGKTAEFIERFFRKGSQPLITGRIQVSSYDDNAGQKRWSTDVIVEEVQFTESRAASEQRMQREGSGSYNAPPQSQSQSMSEPEGFSAIAQSIDEDDDLPF